MKMVKTVKTKQLFVFLLMILFLLVFAGSMFYSIRQFAIHVIYQQMESQAEYYVSSVDAQMEEILRQQADFFADRQMVFLVDEGLLGDYDRRNALLSLQEKLFIMLSSNNLLKDTVLHIPGSDYVITPSTIRKMNQEDLLYLEEISSGLGVLGNEGGNLIYVLSETPYSESVAPNFYLRIVLDREQFIDHLNDFTIERGGSCWYYPEIEWFLEDTAGTGKGETILEAMKHADGMEEVRIGGESFLVNVTKSKYLGWLVQYCSKRIVLEKWEKYTWIFYGFMLLAAGFAILFPCIRRN